MNEILRSEALADRYRETAPTPTGAVDPRRRAIGIDST
jgi:hypothetical protein